MKVATTIITLLVFHLSCTAQNHLTATNKLPLAKIRDQASKIFIFPDKYWDNGFDKKADEIIAQIGKDEFEIVKRNTFHYDLDCQFLIFCEDRDGSAKKDLDTMRQRASRLKMFKIATFTHVNEQKDSSQWVLLRVPYNENKDWGKTVPVPTVKWNTIYFVYPKDELNEEKE